MRKKRKTRVGGTRARRSKPAVAEQSGFGLIEVLVATTVATIGLLSVAGLQLSIATQARIASWRTSQALAAQEVFERINEAGYAAAASGADSATVDGRVYRVNVAVTTPIVRVKQVTATVAAVGGVSARSFVTRIHDRRPVPAAP